MNAKGVVPVPILIIIFIGLVSIGGILYSTLAYPTERKDLTKISPSPSATTQPTAQPEASVSAIPSPSTTASPTVTSSILPKPAYRIDSAVVTYGATDKILVIKGNQFGPYMTPENRILFDGQENKYPGTSLQRFSDKEIVLYLPADFPLNKPTTLAIKRYDGKQSNTVTFTAKDGSNTPNAAYDCLPAKNPRAYALSSTEVKIDWEYEPNVKSFTVLQGFYHDNFWDWLYPRNVITFDGRPNGSLNVTELQPNTTYYFYIALACTNGLGSKNSNIISVTTKP